MSDLYRVEEPELDALSQDKRMRAVLVDMMLLSYGTTTRFDSSTTNSKPTGGNRPPGESMPLHTEWQTKYAMCPPSALEQREQVISDATDALVRVRCGPRIKIADETQEEREERILKAGEGYELEWVARALGMIPREILKVRKKHYRDPHDGRRTAETPGMRQLAELGYTARQISLITGKAPSSAQYHVNKVRRLAA